MSTTTRSARGAYAKGIAKREEILRRALEVIARDGYRGASVKAIADAVGLTQAGLLHYFGSKEALFTEILRERDAIDARRFVDQRESGEGAPASILDGYLRTMRHNAEVPGIVQLFSRMNVDAADPAHPAHEFFRGRSADLRELFVAELGRMQRAGELSGRIDPEPLARILQAVSDGLQVQWMIDPDLDMAAVVEQLFEALRP